MFPQDRGDREEERALAASPLYLADQSELRHFGPCGEIVYWYLKIAQLLSGLGLELAQELEFAQYFNSAGGTLNST